MKVLFALVTVFVVLVQSELSEDQKQTIRTYRQECVNETHVDPDLVYKADRGEFENDKNLKCFAKCFYRKVGFINDKAELQLDFIKSKIPESADRQRALDVIDKCKDVKGSDACDTAFLLHKCYFENTAYVRKEGNKE